MVGCIRISWLQKAYGYICFKLGDDPAVLWLLTVNLFFSREREKKKEGRVQSVSERCIRSPADYATATNYSLLVIGNPLFIHHF